MRKNVSKTLISRGLILAAVAVGGIALTVQSCGNSNTTAAGPKQTAGKLTSVATKVAYPALSFEMPVVMTQEPTDKSSWYVVEQKGLISKFSSDPAKATDKAVFGDLRSVVVSGGERGLLGLAFHPKYPATPHVFVNYTTNISGSLTTVIARYTADAAKGRLNPQSEERLLTVTQPFANHNGGQLDFGPDGYLYIALGDGGSGGDPLGHGQNLGTLLGKILRIDVDAKASGKNYGIPSDNPFTAANQRPEIYAYGLRNPWKFSFDTTGRLWVADVGQNRWEEVNILAKGGNYGWNTREGKHCFNGSSCSSAGMIDPIFEYDHALGQSITGGHVYAGQAIPELRDFYVFADFISGAMWAVKQGPQDIVTALTLPKTDLMISSFGISAEGELFMLNYGEGKIYQLVAK